MLDLCTHREPRLQKNLFAPGPHRIQVKATKHKSSILDKFSFSLSHLRYQIKYKINYKKTGRPGWDDQFHKDRFSDERTDRRSYRRETKNNLITFSLVSRLSSFV